MIRYFIIFIFVSFYLNVWSQEYSISGIITDKETQKPIEFATLSLREHNLWAISDTKGTFVIKNIPEGKIHIIVSCLGYVKQDLKIEINQDIQNVQIHLSPDNLALEEVVVTAKKKSTDLSSSYTIEKNTINHLQMINVADVSSLLPGGQTNQNLKLTTPSYVSLRSEAIVEEGLPSFGTAIEVDGIRLSNNHNYSGDIKDRYGDQNDFTGKTKGADIRTVSTTNIESVEIITGIPSAEEGDLENGIVRINTKKGKSPLSIEMFTNINSKQISVNKGFQLGKASRILNTSFDHTRSISEIMSPYSIYQRNILTLRYSQSFNNSNGQPLLLSAGVTGNLGGYNSESDPDLFVDTYSKERDNTIRANLNLKYLANLPWLTNLNWFMSAVYTDKLYTSKEKKSSASYVAAIHSADHGYFIGELYEDNPNANIILIDQRNWYETYYDDSKSLDLRFKLKADWVRSFTIFQSNFKLGADYTITGNLGDGMYYSDIKTAPTWRSYPYNEIPFMHNLAIFGEEKLTVQLRKKQQFQLSVGLRSDNTWIKESAYGTVSSLSPRINAKYTRLFPEKTVEKFNVHAGWGQTVKLPSFYMLYPKTTYRDLLAFAPGTMSDGSVFYAYHTIPNTPVYNPDLEWQKSELMEIGFDTKVKNITFSLTAYYRKTLNPYNKQVLYTPFNYKLTPQESLNNCNIPEENRSYEINQATGVVTVNDITGNLPSQLLDYKTINNFSSNYTYENGTPIHRYGLEWILDFGKIKALNTSFRIDGNLYKYKWSDETLQASRVSNTESYEYIAFYRGGTNLANAKLKKQVRSNFTVITHIPKIRLIVSLRLEATFYEFNQNLSEYNGEQRGFVIDSKNDYFPSEIYTDIYEGSHYVAIYPEYYVTHDDMETKIPFTEMFAWAKENDPELYSDLAKMVKKTSYLNSFQADEISPYLSANINLTKEIGEHISISFNAKNFFNNMGTVTSSKYDKESTLYGSRYIPSFYYGLTLRLKL